jgi:hypothetical protein
VSERRTMQATINKDESRQDRCDGSMKANELRHSRLPIEIDVDPRPSHTELQLPPKPKRLLSQAPGRRNH